MQESLKKEIQRKQGLAKRKSLLLNDSIKKSDIIRKRVLENAFYKKSNVILTYISFGSEVDTFRLNAFIKKEGKTIAYPLCQKKGIMNAASVECDKNLVKGMFGIIEPDRKASSIMKPTNIDLIIVPCVAFCGNSRMRIGYGGGYYDRFIPSCINAKTMAIAYEIQKINDIVIDSWDIPLDVIITEENIYKA